MPAEDARLGAVQFLAVADGAPACAMQGPILAGGRLNVFMAGGNSYAPNLDIELYSYPFSNKLFMYINLVPRRSLVHFPCWPAPSPFPV